MEVTCQTFDYAANIALQSNRHGWDIVKEIYDNSYKNPCYPQWGYTYAAEVDLLRFIYKKGRDAHLLKMFEHGCTDIPHCEAYMKSNTAEKAFEFLKRSCFALCTTKVAIAIATIGATALAYKIFYKPSKASLPIKKTSVLKPLVRVPDQFNHLNDKTERTRN